MHNPTHSYQLLSKSIFAAKISIYHCPSNNQHSKHNWHTQLTEWCERPRVTIKHSSVSEGHGISPTVNLKPVVICCVETFLRDRRCNLLGYDVAGAPAKLCGRGGCAKVIPPVVYLEQCYSEHWYLCVQTFHSPHTHALLYIGGGHGISKVHHKLGELLHVDDVLRVVRVRVYDLGAARNLSNKI